MKKEDLENITTSITNKLGEEQAAIIRDDLATIMTDNTVTNDLLKNKDKEIEDLKKTKEDLIITNGKLFQQVSMGIEEKEEMEKNTSPNISFNSFLDEKGNFKI